MGEEKEKHWYGFDWLRVTFIAFVIAMHLNLAGENAGADPSWWDVVIADVLGVAVPGFLIMSYFLQVEAREDARAYARRLKRFGALYVFWVGLWFVWTWRGRDSMTLGPVEFLLRGGGWTFYFFTVLLLLCPIARLAGAMNVRTACLWAAALIGLNGVLLVAMASTGWIWTHVATYWWPLNFLAAPFIARVLAEPSVDRKWMLRGLFVAFVVSASLEWLAKAPGWMVGPDRHFLPEYLRPSPILGGALAITAALGVTSAPPAWLTFLSRNSLGIFCLHCFCLKRIVELTAVVTKLDMRWAAVVALPVTLFAMATASELLRRLFRERLI
ncbi:hypothetical protein KBB96_15250 [Luteolibacter ambystomatis]|uniref:Acyltransferase 3 domain-containing protein n=1 Tax=Luteolibacter ambystomatis TaxID=2824561 RepID=A0A975IZU0_9BACT|nr:acyltransferase family protein [Luteolibacter ambystomatis]QUE50220.1 hypothetical protein KBB96_15250 [Luteolibacter ambystomatis]